MINLIWMLVHNNKEENTTGCSYYRIIMPATALNKYSKKYHCDLAYDIVKKEHEKTEETWDRVYKKYDGMILKQLPDPIQTAQVLGSRDFYHKKVIVDFDDNFFKIHKESPVHNIYYKGSIAVTSTKMLFEKADLVTVENETLKKAYGNSTVFPNCINPEDAKKWHNQISKKNDGFIRLGWAGGATHAQDLREIAPYINRLLEKHEKLKFVFVGDSQLINSAGIKSDKIEYIGPNEDYYKYMDKLILSGIDIGIAPLIQNAFNQCKSPCKYFEYSIAGIATVAVGYDNMPYRRAVKHNETGLLYHSPEQFVRHIEGLIKMPETCMEMASNAYNDLLKNYSIDKHWHIWEKALDNIFGGNK